MSVKRQPKESAQAWYQRLKRLRAELDAEFKAASDAASQEINEESAVRKLMGGKRLMPSEAAALKAMPRERVLDLSKEKQ